MIALVKDGWNALCPAPNRWYVAMECYKPHFWSKPGCYVVLATDYEFDMHHFSDVDGGWVVRLGRVVAPYERHYQHGEHDRLKALLEAMPPEDVVKVARDHEYDASHIRQFAVEAAERRGFGDLMREAGIWPRRVEWVVGREISSIFRRKIPYIADKRLEYYARRRIAMNHGSMWLPPINQALNASRGLTTRETRRRDSWTADNVELYERKAVRRAFRLGHFTGYRASISDDLGF